MVVPAGAFGELITLRFSVVGDLLSTDRVVGPHRDGAADDHKESNDQHALAKTGAVAAGALVHDLRFGVLREDVPLNSKTIEADHAVQFRADEEDERVEEAVVIGVDADEVGVKAVRIDEHAHQVREHEEEEAEGRDELNPPEGRVFVMNELDVRADVMELLVGGREATQRAEHVNDHAEEDEANEDDVHPGMVGAVEPDAAGGGDQVGEEVLAEVHGTREGHVAEKEDAEDEAGDGLRHVKAGSALALALGILEAHAPDIVRSGRRMGIFFFISRHFRMVLEVEKRGNVLEHRPDMGFGSL